MEMSNINELLAATEKELKKNPDSWEAWAAKADILCALGMYQKAIECCNRSLELNQNNALTYLTRCMALRKIGLKDEANASLEKARELGYKD